MTTIDLDFCSEVEDKLVNGIISSLNSIVPIPSEVSNVKITEQAVHLQFAVFIGFTGDTKGNIVFAGDISTFENIGQSMFGMPLEGEMLTSFSGELGNMLAGGLSTNIADKGIYMDITSPTVMNGDTTLSGYKKALQITTALNNIGDLDIYLLLD